MSKKRFISVISGLMLIALPAWAQQSPGLVWAKSMGGTNSEYGSSIVVDSSGNIYITGDFWGTADFDPSPAIVDLISAGGADIFVLKLDHNGNLIWAKRWGDTTVLHLSRGMIIKYFDINDIRLPNDIQMR